MRWFILLMIMSGAVQAEIFKCINAAGKKTYQQSPCEEDERVDGYEFREESAATKASRELSRKHLTEKKKADAIEKRNREVAQRKARMERNEERLSNSRAALGEAQARNAGSVADYNKGVANRVKIKNKYLQKELNRRR